MNGERSYSVAVRLSSGKVRTKLFDHTHSPLFVKLSKIPFLRGVLRFADSLIVGMKTLNYSADCFLEEEGEKESPLTTFFVMALGVLLALGLFVLLPQLLSRFLFVHLKLPVFVLGLVEGICRLLIFLIYLLLISRLKDVGRLFMYHGAEHKCIACFEKGLPLTVANVRKQTRFHKRCGTSFLFIVMLTSILVFSLIRVTDFVPRLLIHLAMIPVIAGIAYEILRLSSRSDSKLISALVAPGLWIQHITTREPEDAQIEVGIHSVLTLMEKEHPELI